MAVVKFKVQNWKDLNMIHMIQRPYLISSLCWHCAMLSVSSYTHYAICIILL